MSSQTQPAEEEALIFLDTVDAAFRGLRSALDASARAKLAAVGLNLDKPLLPAYSRTTFVEAIGIAAAAIHPNLPPEHAYRLLGRSAVDSLGETLLGRAQLALARARVKRERLILAPLGV